MLVDLFFHLLGGLGLFLYGMKMMSEGLQVFAGDNMRRALNALTNNRFMGVLVGLVITSIIQSSSVTTVMVVGFVNAGLMTLVQAIGVIMGANIGTTITGWIISLKVTDYALPMVGIGAALYLFSRVDPLRYAGQIIFGIGLIFYGLFLMKHGFKPLRDDPSLLEWFTKFNADHYSGVLLCVATGCAITMILQSSSATMGLTIAMAMEGIIGFNTSVALIFGENIGTTITANIAAIGTNRNAKRAARAHFLFNVFGVSILMLFFYQYIHLIDYLVPGDPMAMSAGGERTNIAVHIAASHSVFNIFNVIVWIPWVKFLARAATWMVPDEYGPTGEVEDQHLVFIDSRLISSPAVALNEATRALKSMVDSCWNIFNHSYNILATPGMNLDHTDEDFTVREVFRLEAEVDDNLTEIMRFLETLNRSSLTAEQAQETRRLARVAKELESISDQCESLAKLFIKVRKGRFVLPETVRREVDDVHRVVREYLSHCLVVRPSDPRGLARQARNLSNELKHRLKEYAQMNRERLDAGEVDVDMLLYYADILFAYRRIRKHALNVAESLAGGKKRV